jgi:uncharacterized flavoprotein (TIGR03862 family)
VIVGAGPAGLMAAQTAALAARDRQLDLCVQVFDAMPSVGRKFLLAGIGGLNLTHAQPLPDFLDQYLPQPSPMRPVVMGFTPTQLCQWAHDLGIQTFVGTSMRVFPVDKKAAPLLRAWIKRLRSLGVQFFSRHRWTGFEQNHTLVFDTPLGLVKVQAEATVLALGGASWARLGSDGAWVELLRGQGVDVAPLVPSNCGFETQQPLSSIAQTHAGKPLKPLGLAWLNEHKQMVYRRGECVLTRYGLEGQVIYAASAQLRDQIAQSGHTSIWLDLLPDQSELAIQASLAKRNSKKSLSSFLKTQLGLSPQKVALLYEWAATDIKADAAKLAHAIKALPVVLARTRPIDEAISSAGGVRFGGLDSHLMLNGLPGVFVAGEMLDWEAPTGGYLLNGCFASGKLAGEGAVQWLSTAPST